MRAMEAELGMYKQQVDLFKSDIEAANEAMRALRQRWVANQRRSKIKQAGSGSDETINLTANTWDSSSPVAATASAESMPPLSQDEEGNGSSTILDKSIIERDRTQEPQALDNPPAVAVES